MNNFEAIMAWLIVITICLLIGYIATIHAEEEEQSIMKKPFMPKTITNMLNDGIFVANVTKIIDGDTFTLDSGEKIRLTLVNTPERKETGYQEAKNWLAATCLNQTAVIDLDNGQISGSYGRYIGWVDRCGDSKDINSELLDLGLAKVFDRYCKTSEFKSRVKVC